MIIWNPYKICLCTIVHLCSSQQRQGSIYKVPILDGIWRLKWRTIVLSEIVLVLWVKNLAVIYLKEGLNLLCCFTPSPDLSEPLAELNLLQTFGICLPFEGNSLNPTSHQSRNIEGYVFISVGRQSSAFHLGRSFRLSSPGPRKIHISYSKPKMIAPPATPVCIVF